MVMKIKKRKKAGRMHGKNSHGHGSRKKWRSSGEQGGKGMSGTGKRADHKKSLIIKLYGNKYFGKQGITSKGTERKKIKWINLRDIEKNIEKYKDKNGEIMLKDYKILGEGEITKPWKIKAKAFTSSARKKIEKAGGKAIELMRGKKEVEKNSEDKIKSEKKIESKDIKAKSPKLKSK